MPFLIRLFCLVLLTLLPLRGHAAPVLAQYLSQIPAAELVEGADGYGPIRADIPVAPVLKGDELLGYAFITSDFVGTTGYSGKPIHTLVALSPEAKVLGMQLVKHSEPIVLIGIPDAKIKALVGAYVGLDLVAEAKSGGASHEVDIISGATVTVMVIDDSIVRSGLKVARVLGLSYPALLALLLIGVGLGLTIRGMRISSRQLGVTRYRPAPWGGPEYLTVACALAGFAVIAFAASQAGWPRALNPPSTPFHWPTLPPVVLLAAALFALPGFLTPSSRTAA